MCNLYRMTGAAQAIAHLFAVDTRGRNLPAFPEIWPSNVAPVVTDGGQTRELVMMRWGWPPFGQLRRPITNVRNCDSPLWRGALANPAQRCLVPVSAFAEWSEHPDPVTRAKRAHWFALPADPLFAFAGLWRGSGDEATFAFLTCEANALVGAVHPKAMPVILRAGEEAERWLTGDVAAVRALQRPFPDALMAQCDPPAPSSARLSVAPGAPVQGDLFGEIAPLT